MRAYFLKYVVNKHSNHVLQIVLDGDGMEARQLNTHVLINFVGEFSL